MRYCGKATVSSFLLLVSLCQSITVVSVRKFINYHLIMADGHPLLAKLKSLCKCHDVNEGKAHLVFEVYMELCEVLKLWDVNYYFNEKLKLFYLTGRIEKRNENINVYVPITTNETFSVEYLEILQETLSPSNEKLILVFKDRDSSAAYYEITKGLVKPDSPETSQKQKIHDKKNVQYQRLLTKWKKKLFDKAMETGKLEED